MKKLFPIAAIFLAACGGSKEQAAEVQTKSENVVQLTAEQLNQTSITLGNADTVVMQRAVKGTATVVANANENFEVTAPFGGYIVSTQVIPGQRINAGQVIGVLENPDFITLQQDYLSASNEYEMLNKNLVRQTELLASKATSDKAYEEVKSATKQAEIKTMALRERLVLLGIDVNKLSPSKISARVNVVAKNNGVVTSVDANSGAYLGPGSVWMRYMSNEHALLQMEIFEKDLAYVAVGQHVHAEDLSGSNKTLDLSVNLISPNVDASGKVKVYCNLPTGAAIPGSIWNIQIDVPTASTLALPNTAIVSDHYVFLDKGNNTFEMKEVQLGFRNETYSEILNTTEIKNERIVLTGAYTIYMQLKNSSEE